MSEFETDFELAFEDSLVQLGDLMLYEQPPGGTYQQVRGIFNEYAGAVDDQARALFSVSKKSGAVTENVTVGDHFYFGAEADVLAENISALEQWTVTDVRDSKDGTAEIRADRSKLEVNQ